MLADDLGFADLACYGSEIDTPNLDALAAGGVRYTNFHVNPMCSPTRASMLTGLNHHMAGMGHVAHSDPGFPGYTHELRDDAVTMAELFRDNGWASLMVGKWHLCKDAHLSDAGPRHSWPLQKGFERYYGILDGFTNFHQPHRLYEDNHHIPVDQYPDDYYFTDDLTDQAIHMIDEVRASHPTKPFFMYFAHGAVHAPLQAKVDDIEKYRGVYDAGWDEIRRQRYERQLEMGVIPSHTELPPRNTEAGHAVEAWDNLSDDERQIFARYMEIFAGMVDNIDQNLGRLRPPRGHGGVGQHDHRVHLRQRRLARRSGTRHVGVLSHPRQPDPPEQPRLGGSRPSESRCHGWADQPAALSDGVGDGVEHAVPALQDQHAPGRASGALHRHWPAGLSAAGEVRTQYQHITDLLPTLAELCGVEVPTTKGGRPVPEPAGASMVPTLDDGGIATTHPEQYYEQIGHRSFYRDGWSAVTCRQPRAVQRRQWELHNLRRSDGDQRPRGRASGEAQRAPGRLGGCSLGQPGLPAR